MSKAGRGLPFTYDIPYDSTIWSPTVSGSTTSWGPQYALTPMGWPTFNPNVGVVGGSIQCGTTLSRTQLGGACNVDPADPSQPPVIWAGTQYNYSNYAYVDPKGTSHAFPSAVAIYVGNASPSCPYGGGPSNPTGTTNYTSVDGFTLAIVENSSGVLPNVTNKAGKNVTPSSGTCGSAPYAGTYIDANGNEISQNCGVFTDTLGQTALTITGNTPSPVTFTATNYGGSSVSTLEYESVTVRTNFGCFGVSEYGPTATYLPSEITLADGRSYSFTYETTPGYAGDVTGRIASVTLPTGGKISYTYTGGSNGINCADGSTSGLTRTVVDNINPSQTTTYARSYPTSGEMQTTITYPTYASVQNQTVITFSGNGLTSYEVARQIYTGSSTSGTLMETILDLLPIEHKQLRHRGGHQWRYCIRRQLYQRQHHLESHCLESMAQQHRHHIWNPNRIRYGPESLVERSLRLRKQRNGQAIDNCPANYSLYLRVLHNWLREHPLSPGLPPRLR